MDLALFDLDNTLLAGDSDYEWGNYLCEIGATDAAQYKQENQRFYADYCAARLDINAYLRFVLKALAENDTQRLLSWRRAFIDTKILPMVTPQAKQLVAAHTDKGDHVIVISSTIDFLVKPIARLFDIEHVIATQAETDSGGKFSGRVTGIPCFAEGKLRRLEQWLKEHKPNYDQSWFYSDSINDLATLKWADNAVVVNGDARLVKEAARYDWRMISVP